LQWRPSHSLQAIQYHTLPLLQGKLNNSNTWQCRRTDGRTSEVGWPNNCAASSAQAQVGTLSSCKVLAECTLPRDASMQLRSYCAVGQARHGWQACRVLSMCGSHAHTNIATSSLTHCWASHYIQAKLSCMCSPDDSFCLVRTRCAITRCTLVS
jgi:hypothetical protein